MKTTKINGHKAAPYIAQRIDFTSHGALSSRTYTSDDFAPNYYGGQLPREHLDALIAAHKAGTVYVVFSYETPIAWYSYATETWTIPNVKYSITTTQHQGRVYLGSGVTPPWCEPGYNDKRDRTHLDASTGGDWS